MANITDQFGNTITESGGGAIAWTFNRTLDNITILRPGSEAQATAESRVLQAYNAMIPAADFVANPPSDIKAFCDSLMAAAIANGSNTLIQNAAQFITQIDFFLRQSPGQAKVVWTAYKASPPAWLTAGVITTIQNIAVTCNITLV